MLDEIVGEITQEAAPTRKRDLAKRLGVDTGDRTFERALESGIETGTLERPKRGSYALGKDAE